MQKIELSKQGKNNGLYFTLVDDDDYERLKDYRWFFAEGYARTAIDKKSVFMHRMILNACDGLVVDHKNLNTLDNQKNNLRLSTTTENEWDKPKTKRKVSSKYRGVNWYKPTKKWVAKITKDNKKIFLGYFGSEVAAAKAYDKKALAFRGEFARLNII